MLEKGKRCSAESVFREVDREYIGWARDGVGGLARRRAGGQTGALTGRGPDRQGRRSVVAAAEGNAVDGFEPLGASKVFQADRLGPQTHVVVVGDDDVVAELGGVGLA